MAKILLVEDDKALAEAIGEFLKTQGYSVEMTHTGASGRDLLRTYTYDIIILDWTLPEMSGLDVCKDFRSRGGHTPILFLTGRTTIVEKEAALDSGSDDYLTKPFQVQELAARIRALLRRPPIYHHKTLKVRDIELDPSAHTVKKDGKEIKLYPREFSLLEFFLRNPNQIFSAEKLVENVWGSESDVTIETLRVSLARIRQALSEEKDRPLIKNIYGVGYKLEA